MTTIVMSSEHPPYHQQEEFRLRSQKLQEIRSLGIEPYPACYRPSHTALSVTEMFGEGPMGHSEDASAGVTPNVVIAGRVVLFRAMGKNAFLQLQDGTGRLQVMCNRELTLFEGFTPNEAIANSLKFLEKKIDLGDILGIEGHLFRTHVGELTLYAKKVTLLCKALLPLPDKHSGLADKGTRYRKRWLDLIAHQDVMKSFHTRSSIMRQIRYYMEHLGYLEVETPVLQNVYGGAEARPFTTHLNAHNQDMFLRISLEIPLKKLLVGGIERLYEIGKVFRNEGIDRTHNPEFTMLEAYAAYLDYTDGMRIVENLFETIALKLLGTTILRLPVNAASEEPQEILVDLKTPWKRMTMKDAISIYGGHEVDLYSDEKMAEILLQKGCDPKKVQGKPRGNLIALFFEEFAEEHLIQPHHIIDHPIETTPLCKLHRQPKEREERLVERFETFIMGREMCNAYSELNDPELQRSLLEAQAKKREQGDEEASPMDEEFLEAIAQGMPPACGFGIGLDRLTMLFTGAASIRDVLYFPIMRPGE